MAESDGNADTVVADLSLELRTIRSTSLMIPAAALVFLIVTLAYWPLFSFAGADGIALGAIAVAGAILAVICYRRPAISVALYEALWHLRPKALAIFLILLVIPAFVFQSIFLSRVFAGILLLPAVAAMWTMYREYRGADWLARAFPLLFMIMAAVPGFVLPPYYQGIVGWTTRIEDTETVRLAGYQLVNDRGDRIWVTHTLYSPVTQVGRFDYAWSDKVDKIGSFEAFILKAYRRSYPLLVEGYMPHQRYLGKLAYPSSTYSTNLPDHTEFPPDRIRNVQYVGLIYNRAKELVDVEVYRDYEVPAP